MSNVEAEMRRFWPAIAELRAEMKRLWSAIAELWTRSVWFRAGVLFLCGLVAVVALVNWAPTELASTHGLKGKDRVEEIGRVRTALLAILAGSLAAFGAIHTARTFALSRQGQFTDRLTRAVDQLGNDKLDVRLGGIYALERLLREPHADHRAILEMLTAYVRAHAPSPRLGGGPTNGARLGTDVHAVLTVLGRRAVAVDQDPELELSDTALSGARLERADLRRANFARAELDGALLTEANMKGTVLNEANLSGASLQGADLEGAGLNGVHLERANVANVNLNGAVLAGGKLEGTMLAAAQLQSAAMAMANLEGATLMSANLRRANLGGASLRRTNLAGASLQGANLVGANLEDANLAGANLQGANLVGANLQGVNLHGVRHDPSTTWPASFDPVARGALEVSTPNKV
jgi:uncharacterized protein YjbI with pentapeptide repeats